MVAFSHKNPRRIFLRTTGTVTSHLAALLISGIEWPFSRGISVNFGFMYWNYLFPCGWVFRYTSWGEYMLNRFLLDGNWELAAFEAGHGDLPSPEIPFPIPAKVPGEVHPALIDAEIINEADLGSEQLRWIDQSEWHYWRTFSLPDGFVKRRSILEFDGLDTEATVILNGEVVGTSHNMFIPHQFDVTGKLNVDEENTIEVKFAPPATLSSDETEVRKWKRSLDGEKPSLTGAGIWRSARVVSYDKVSIHDIHIQPSIEIHGAEAWLAIEVDNHTDEDIDTLISIVVAREESHEKMEIKQAIPPGGCTVESVVRILEPELWWPNGAGDQPIYVVMVGLQAEGEVQDAREERFGLRTFNLQDQDEDGTQKLSFFVNDAPVEVNGATWTPPDTFPSRMTESGYRNILGKMRESGINMLRVCGSGVYEAPVFYKLCDELGIMIWQDFMFPSDGRPHPGRFLFEAQDEVREVVKRLRNHPSIVLWCGCGQNAENSLFDEVIPRAVNELDDSRPYRASVAGEEPVACWTPETT